MEELGGLLVVVVAVLAVEIRCLRGHRRVEVQRQQRDLAALDEPVQLPDDLLRAPDRERRHEQHAPGVVDDPHGLGEEADGLALGLVFAAAVRRLDEDVVRGVERRRVAQDRGPGAAEVAGADDDALLPARCVLHPQPDHRRAEDVPGVEERRVDPRRDLELLAVADGPERTPAIVRRPSRCRAVRRGRFRGAAAGPAARPRGRVARSRASRGRVSVRWWSRRAARSRSARRLRRPRQAVRGRCPSRRPRRGPRLPRTCPPAAVFGRGLVRVALLPAGIPLRELLVELARVEQDQSRQLDRPRRREDRAPIAGLHEQRDQPAMVEMSMGQQHGVEGRGVEVERDPVADRLVRAALEHPAIDEDPRLAGLEQVLRARHGRGAAQEVDLHRAR